MTKFKAWCFHLFLRVRYPASLPEDVGLPLGFSCAEVLSFRSFLKGLCCSDFHSATLHKFMPRQKAEALFQKAVKFERYKNETLFFFDFPSGWLEVILSYDKEARLRRVYVWHRWLDQDPKEISLQTL